MFDVAGRRDTNRDRAALLEWFLQEYGSRVYMAREATEEGARTPQLGGGALVRPRAFARPLLVCVHGQATVRAWWQVGHARPRRVRG